MSKLQVIYGYVDRQDQVKSMVIWGISWPSFKVKSGNGNYFARRLHNNNYKKHCHQGH